MPKAPTRSHHDCLTAVVSLVLHWSHGARAPPVDIRGQTASTHGGSTATGTPARSLGRICWQDLEPQNLLLELVESQVSKLVESQLEGSPHRVHLLHELHVVGEHLEPLGLFLPLEVEAVLRHPRFEQAHHSPTGPSGFELTSVVEDYEERNEREQPDDSHWRLGRSP